MPKLKKSPTELANTYLLTAIGSSAIFYADSPLQQARIVGLSRASWYRRLKAPGTFTVDELRKLARHYRWDNETLLKIVGWQ